MTSTADRVDDIDYQIWIGTVVTVVAATGAVTLRLVSRHIAKAGYWWDDWVIIASLIVNWGMAATRWAQVLIYDFGRHREDNPVENVVGYQKSFMAIQLVYFTNTVLTKSSLLLLYQRIFGIVRRFRYALWTSWFLITSYFVACVIASIAGCKPPSYLWDRFRSPDTDPPGGCFDEIAFFRWNGLANMLLDILMLVLPLPMVWRIRMSKRQKFLLTGIFLMGSFVCIVSLLRIISFDVSDRRDPTYTQVPSSTWSSVEQGVAIVCACLPTLRPLRRLCGGRFRRDSWKCKGSGFSNSASNTKSNSNSNSNSNSGSNRSSGCERRGMVQVQVRADEIGGGDDGDERRRWADYAGPELGPGSGPGHGHGPGSEHGHGLDPDRDPVGAYAHPDLWGENRSGVDGARGESLDVEALN